MNWLLVACGGALGAMGRYGLGQCISQPQQVFPWATWWINIIGCLLAGVFFALSQRFPILQQEARLLLMFAFVNEVIDHIRMDALKDRLHLLVEKRFRGELNKCQGCAICK